MLMKIKQMFALKVLTMALAVSLPAQSSTDTKGQAAGPSTPTRPFIVMPAQSLSDLEQRLRNDNKVEELIGGAGLQLRVAVQHDQNRVSAQAEVHDASDDVYYVLDGTATLTLGGKLDSPREVEPGEWRSARITGGQTFEIKKGDLIVVPRGTPHQRTARDFSMILIKIFAEPVRAKQPKPSAAGKEQKP